MNKDKQKDYLDIGLNYWMLIMGIGFLGFYIYTFFDPLDYFELAVWNPTFLVGSLLFFGIFVLFKVYDKGLFTRTIRRVSWLYVVAMVCVLIYLGIRFS